MSFTHPPPHLPGYRVLAEVHAGGQGVVYRAVQESIGRPVALKLIRPDGVGGASAADRLRREGRLAARLNHPNVVGVYDLLETPAGFVLVMEYVDGIDLQRWVEADGPPPVEVALDVVRQAAAGLRHAFAHGVVHRDLKPGNLLRRADGIVKVCDLGLARGALAETEASSLTTSHGFLGSVDYIAPEQIENPRDVDARADLYALGCTLYFLLTGRVPFPNRTLMKKLDAHRWEQPRPVEELRTEVPDAVARVCRRLMMKDRADRYATAAELIDELDALKLVADPSASTLDLAVTPPRPVGRFPPGYVGEYRCFRGHPEGLTAVAFADAGRLVVSSAFEPVIRVWDVEAGTCRHELAGHDGAVWLVTGDPAGRVVWSVGADRTVRGWDVVAGVPTGLVRAPDAGGELDSLCVSPDGRVLAAWYTDGRIVLWDCSSGVPVERYRGSLAENEEPTYRVVFATAAPVAATAVSVRPEREHGWVVVGDLAAGREVRRLGPHAGPVFAVDISADGKTVAAGGYDRTIWLWDVATGEEVRCFEGHRWHVRGVGLTADLSRLVSVSNDHTVRVWDVATGGELARFGGHTDQVTRVAVRPDGAFAVTGSADKTVRVWKLPANATESTGCGITSPQRK